MVYKYLRAIYLMAAFILCWIPGVSVADSSQRLVQMLDYIGVDYPPTVENGEVVDAVEYAEMREFSAELKNLLETMPDHPDKPGLMVRAEKISSDVKRRVPGAVVATQTQQLKASLIETYQLVVGPSQVPDMSAVQQLYDYNCASCHGLEGKGDGSLAVGMEPAPSNFHDMSRQHTRSVYDLYNTISLGVAGTSMNAFTQLSDEQRWALALRVSQFSGTSEQRDIGQSIWQQGKVNNHFNSLSDITSMSYAQAKELGSKSGIDGEALLVYLRSSPDALDVSSNEAIDNSIAKLDESLEAARAGDRDKAHKLALSAYLDGFELSEATLSVVNKVLMKQIEKEMIVYREMTRKGQLAEVEQQQEKVLSLLVKAKEEISSSRMSAGAAFLGSFVILLREGFEAILVLAAILAALIKTGRKEAIKFIHFGWIGAIVVGIATWWIAENLISISGASREITEGVAALFASAILIYVGFWLHNACNSKRWQKFVEHKIDSAMETSTLWVLGSVTFIAVYREMFETVLFYQAMWVQIDAGSENGFLLGILAAIAMLLILAFLIFKVGVSLPIKQFFQINAVLLFLLAVIFSGQGIAALQEAGIVAVSLFDSVPSIELLGIYPTAESIGLQLFVLTLGAFLFAYQRKTQ